MAVIIIIIIVNVVFGSVVVEALYGKSEGCGFEIIEL
jgi:carbon starvation protein CstA